MYARSSWDQHMFPPRFPPHLVLQQKRQLVAAFREWDDGAAAEVDINTVLYGNTGSNLGGAYAAFVSRRPFHDDVYPEYTPTESNKGWHGDWFYIRNPSEAPFPEFHGGRPVRELSWTWGTPTSEKFLAREIKEVIRKHVVEAGLNGATLFFTMREWRVMPLAERRMPLWLYSGPSDLDRAFAEELPEDDVYS
ncbi:hypothetical protein C2845_PM09G12570 [Panicum miliaceum]|uniref:Uncharacterized protein n=1 Tax=Panicum miliaceum TaxID=4540 RepID=A0A3L6S119_PANMI|nr:hypothetical protein C2845_PM09G12570 [Panicum miliaceum]